MAALSGSMTPSNQPHESSINWFSGRKLFLLVGGVSKGADFSELAPILKNLNVQLCCFGQDGDAFMSLHPSAKRFESINEIIHGSLVK